MHHVVTRPFAQFSVAALRQLEAAAVSRLHFVLTDSASIVVLLLEVGYW